MQRVCLALTCRVGVAPSFFTFAETGAMIRAGGIVVSSAQHHGAALEHGVQHARGRTTLIAITCLVCIAGCGPSGLPRVVSGPVSSSSDPPEVKNIRDLGSVRLTPGEPIPDRGDGVAVVGELVLISGRHFGRRARVTVSGMVAEQVARTEGSGIVIRVPWGVRTGKTPFTVKNPEGQSTRTFEVRRHALASVPSRDRVFVLQVSRQRVRLSPRTLHIPGADQIRYCADGQTAYVTGRSGRGLLVAVVDMTAPGGPTLGRSQTMPGEQMLALTAAEHLPVAIAFSDSHMMVLDTQHPLQPALYRPRPLPDELKGEPKGGGQIMAAEMNPDGTLLAVLLRKSNEVLLYNVSGPDAQIRLLARNEVIPRARTTAPLLRDLRFSADSSTLWIVSGETHASQPHGRFPLRLTALKIQMTQHGATRRFGVLSVWRSLDVPDARRQIQTAAPVSLAVARGQPTARGTTVSIPPARAAVFITAHDSRLLRLARTRFDRQWGLRQAVQILTGANPLGMLIRTDIDGESSSVLTLDTLPGAVEITSDSQVLLVASARVETRRKPAAVRLIYGVTAFRVFGKQPPQFVQLAEVDPEALKRPFLLGEVRVQP